MLPEEAGLPMGGVSRLQKTLLSLSPNPGEVPCSCLCTYNNPNSEMAFLASLQGPPGLPGPPGPPGPPGAVINIKGVSWGGKGERPPGKAGNGPLLA